MSKRKVPTQMSCHKKSSNEIWKPYHLTIHEIWPMLKFLRSRSHSKVTRAKMKVPIERSCHSFMNIIIIHIDFLIYIWK
jgi:hypothetical protein